MKQFPFSGFAAFDLSADDDERDRLLTYQFAEYFLDTAEGLRREKGQQMNNPVKPPNIPGI